jgi:hypothetical protein
MPGASCDGVGVLQLSVRGFSNHTLTQNTCVGLASTCHIMRLQSARCFPGQGKLSRIPHAPSQDSPRPNSAQLPPPSSVAHACKAVMLRLPPMHERIAAIPTIQGKDWPASPVTVPSTWGSPFRKPPLWEGT